MLLCLTTGDINFDHLVKVKSATVKVLFPPWDEKVRCAEKFQGYTNVFPLISGLSQLKSVADE